MENSTLKQYEKTLKEAGLYAPDSMLSISADSKTVKGEQYGYLTGILYMDPSLAVCSASELAGCLNVCLNKAGLGGVYPRITLARINKREIYLQYPHIFYYLVKRSIEVLARKAARQGLDYCVRLNGTSDCDHTDFIASQLDTQFYDYSKLARLTAKGNKLSNYDITFSYSGEPAFRNQVIAALKTKANIAAVFKHGKKGLPKTFMGLPVLNGDATDLRFLDKHPDGQCVIGLYAKGPAKKSNSLFLADNSIPTITVNQ